MVLEVVSRLDNQHDRLLRNLNPLLTLEPLAQMES